jgi:hypothetical protein
VNGVVPSNMLTELTVPDAGTSYVVANVSTDGKRVVSAALAVVGSPPSSPGVEMGAAPASFSWPVFLRGGGSNFELERVNLNFTPVEAIREAVASPSPAAPQWDSYWTWRRV